MIARFAVMCAVALLAGACVTNIAAEKASRFDDGAAAYDAGDFAAAYRIWSELAEEDDLAAMRNAAHLLRHGKGVKKDSGAAFRLYREAAEKGLVTAMANVAELYFNGEGTERNTEAAAAWYARAASAGLSLAQLRLSEMYDAGVGVERDPARARALLERAARNGYAPAQTKLAALGGTPESDPAAPADPDDPFVPPARTSAEGQAKFSPGEPLDPQARARLSPAELAQFNAASSAYAAGNKVLAFNAWKNMAAKGNADAQLRVGKMYERGEGVGQDMIEAYRWLKMAANQGHAKAAADLRFVAAQLAPAERAIGDSMVKTPAAAAGNAP